MRLGTLEASSTPSTLLRRLRPRRRNLQMVSYQNHQPSEVFLYNGLLNSGWRKEFTCLMLSLVLWLICREISNAGIPGFCDSAQCYRSRSLWQTLTTPFWPMAQQHYSNIQGLGSFLSQWGLLDGFLREKGPGVKHKKSNCHVQGFPWTLL